jgi:hypothetical protein
MMTAPEFQQVNAVELYAAQVALTAKGQPIFGLRRDVESIECTEIKARVLAAELIEIEATPTGKNASTWTWRGRLTYSGPFTVEWMPDRN